ncbi:archaeosortase C, PEF-CTERM variant [Candidatus Methanoperedens nitroreducens]|uniref:Archaeosortase C, PEF-CTERM variant n=1 Tax=Candidatus Methanoperedens nitratireducens TaxID=1392998 RepID=A0A062V9R7_9EURY|nr:archaeosortase C [Candidatus Methanoperedens nitroreducens]KCZ72454.1 archaeosortase C, PEF-CTERM variant [Candidatus Methanoperedens nitroreducens]MDJ1423612.1 archaeosortase C [Candidatus Methanoperedens sp.]
MNLKNPSFLLVLFITFLIASYVELTFGGFGSSGYLALVFFIIALIILAKLKGTGETRLKPSKKLSLLGGFIIIADIIYNVRAGSDFQTLDTMLIFLGISLISLNIKNSSISNMGEFGAYFSSIFLLLFISVYAMPSRLGSNIYDDYGYYATTLPALFILRSMDISLHMDSLVTFHVYGIEDIYYKIDLGCFGFYSMILIISTVFAYRLTSPRKNHSHSIIKITVVLIIASYLANLFRIISLVSIGYYYGLETMQIFHTFLGWALFAAIVLPIAYFYLR